jgi:hypothetical protein
MYIYNVTINIEETVHKPWLEWMRDKHIPDMLATGKFVQARICRVMVEEESGGITYAVQYFTTSREVLQRYYEEDADRLRKEALRQFPDKFVAFRTELEVIDDQSFLT